MKKILILDNSTSSLYRFRKEVIAAFAADGRQVTVSAPDDGFLDKLKATAFIDTPISRHGKNPVRDFALILRYRELMREIRPDIVFTYTIKPNIYGNLAAASCGIPVISTVTGLGRAFEANGLLSHVVKHLYRAAFRKTARILFLNRDDMEFMRNAGLLPGRERLLTSGEGVNLSEFPAMEYPDAQTVSFLYAGRIMRSKGIGQLIEASRKLKAEYPGAFTVTLIGYHEDDLLSGKQEWEDAVHYAGFQQDIKPFLRDAHCVVLPSYYKEGMPVSLLEAAASARPLITTDINGCREAVEDTVTGFLCRPYDAENLYDCMKRFLELPHERRAEMGKASRRKAEAEFDRRMTVDTMMELAGW